MTGKNSGDFDILDGYESVERIISVLVPLEVMLIQIHRPTCMQGVSVLLGHSGME